MCVCVCIIAGITQHPANDAYCEGNNAVLSCVIFDNSTSNGADNTVWFTNGDPPVAVSSSMISNSRDGHVVTSVLTIESVSLNDDGNGYLCVPSLRIESNVGVISVAGDMNMCVCHMYDIYHIAQL